MIMVNKFNLQLLLVTIIASYMGWIGCGSSPENKDQDSSVLVQPSTGYPDNTRNPSISSRSSSQSGDESHQPWIPSKGPDLTCGIPGPSPFAPYTDGRPLPGQTPGQYFADYRAPVAKPNNPYTNSPYNTGLPKLNCRIKVE